MFDLVGAFDKAVLGVLPAASCGRYPDIDATQTFRRPHGSILSRRRSHRVNTCSVFALQLDHPAMGEVYSKRPSAASRHDRPCVPHAKDDHDGPPSSAAKRGLVRRRQVCCPHDPAPSAEEGRIVSYHTENIRNIALAGHAGVGKTTLFEALLQAGGVIQTIGSVERGTTQSDTDAQEKARGHSIDSCIAGIDRGDSHINLIDTAGYADFRGARFPPSPRSKP